MSACASKIPVAAHRRPSLETSAIEVATTSSPSRIPIASSSTSPRRSSSVEQVSPSRTPNLSRNHSPERKTSTSSSKIPTSIPTTTNTSSSLTSSVSDLSPSRTPKNAPRDRPQSIDIEDEFKSKIQYGRFLQQISNSSRAAIANNGSGNENPLSSSSSASPSRIPVAASISSRKSSLDASPSRTPNTDLSPSRTPNNGSTISIDECDIETERLIPSTTYEDNNRTSPSRSKIPTLKGSRSSSPPKVAQSLYGWSPTSSDRHYHQELTPNSSAVTSPNKSSSSQVPFSTLKDQTKLNHSNSSSGNSLHRMQSSSSQTSVSGSTSSSTRSQRSGSSGAATDSATEQLIQSEDKIESRSRKKQYEAFVMTGDRMICLAKTPANSDFLSKTSNKTTGGLEKIPYDLNIGTSSSSTTTTQHFDSIDVEADVKEESVDEDHEDTTLTSVSGLANSGDIGLDTTKSSTSAATTTAKELISSKKPIQRKSSQKRQASMESGSSPGGSRRNHNPTTNPAPQSPDLSTSSLISSEHYNGESLLDQDNLISPQSSSSPDTPEWSLIDSYHKQKSGEAKLPLLPIASDDDDERNHLSSNHPDDSSPEEAIISEGNRVIITIGTSTATSGSSSHISDIDFTNNVVEGLSLSKSNTTGSAAMLPPTATSGGGGSGGGAIGSSQMPSNYYEDNTFQISNYGQSSATNTNYPSLNSAESSEESDLESLRSYHPPAKAVDVPSAVRLAKRLYHLEGFRRTDVSRHLGKNNDFSQVVAEEYLRYFDFSGSMSLDMALRCFLQQFCLTGETQERERVLLHFSRRYLECNPEFIQNTNKQRQLFRSLDAVHTLTCAIMLLNTDLHGESVGHQRKMTCNEFIENLSELNDGQNFSRELLRSIYYAIKDSPIPWAPVDEEEIPPNQQNIIPAANNSNSTFEPISKVVASLSDHSKSGGISDGEPTMPSNSQDSSKSSVASNLSIGQTAGGINPFLTLPDPSSAVDYKKGYVMRKCCFDPHGKKTKLGKRSWRMYFVTLRDMVLYCFKDEKSLRQPGAYEDFSAAIRIHHGLAVRASDYTKKQFVFRLYTADQAEYLFQTSDEKELLTWIDAINYVVASFSARVLGTPCSSGGRFQRPLLPSSKSSLSMSDQLVSHESQLQSLRRDIEDHLQNPPPKNAKANFWQNYKEKQEFLKFEIMRYETYILTLRTKNAHEP